MSPGYVNIGSQVESISFEDMQVTAYQLLSWAAISPPAPPHYIRLSCVLGMSSDDMTSTQDSSLYKHAP